MRRIGIGIACLISGVSLHAASLTDQSISALQAQMADGQLSAVRLVQYYRVRIQSLDRRGPGLHAIISINPDALAIARALDRERHERGPRSALHGIPVLIKDNIESADHMPTTAGSLALIDNFSGHDAPVVAALRSAGAIILGKTNLSEWANIRSSHAMSGWSAMAGLTRNPYVLDRTACGSSSGTAAALAADMAVAGLGSETDGSITCPSAMLGLVGLKPTLGLLSQQGIVPIAHSQDTAGPMARSVSDVALMLSAMTRAAQVDYLSGLKKDALQGVRIGVLRFRSGSHPEMDVVYERALSALRRAGAQLFEVATPDLTPIALDEQKVMATELKNDLNKYLAATPGAVKPRDLTQLIAFNRASPYELEYFGQDLFEQAERTRGLEDPGYQAALREEKRLAGVDGIDRLLREQQLQLLVAPTMIAAWRVDSVFGDPNADGFTTLAAVAGYPHLTVPMGQVEHLPVGLSFMAGANTEARLLAAGYAYEQLGPGFAAPQYRRSLESELDAPRSVPRAARQQAQAE